MRLAIISLLIIVLLVGCVCVVILPRPWQRVVVLLFVGIPVFLMLQSVTEIGRKEAEVWNYNSNIIPARELWSTIRKDVDSGQYELARAHLELITSKWSEIGVKPHSYAAWKILKEIQAAQPTSAKGTDCKPTGADQPAH